MCRDLAGELANFDYQKEQELRSVFLEYAALFCEKFQRVSRRRLGIDFTFVVFLVSEQMVQFERYIGF